MMTTNSLAFFLALGLGFTQAASEKPNLLFIVTDNQPHWALGCAGSKFVHTPHLDQLASEGVRFTNAFATTPICAASRASLFTGRYRRTHGFTFLTKPLSRDMVISSYPARLRAAGYRTALIGKFGIEANSKLQIENEKESLPTMFDHFDNFEHWGKSGPKGYFVDRPDGSKQHLTDYTRDKATTWLKGQKKDQPFCLTLCFNAPHAQDDDPKQYFWPKRFDKLYANVTIPPRPNAEPAFFANQPEFLRKSLGRDRWHWRFDTPEKYQHMMKGMLRMVSAIDDAVGHLRTQLKESGLDQDTVILFTSDNGMFFGDRGLSDCWLLHEESIRVPLLIFDPQKPRPKQAVRDELVLNLDLANTLLDFGKANAPPVWPGQSLVPFVHGRAVASWRDDFLCEHLFEHRKIPKSEGVRTQRWKYIRYFEQDPVYEELYDLEKDPHESTNLVGNEESQPALEALRKRCDTLIRLAEQRRTPR